MKNHSIILTAILLVMSMLITAELVSFSTGAPTNATGSPGNNHMTCVQCHASNNNEKLKWITSTELNDGYSPGMQYNMRAKAEKPGCTKFGFLITIEKPDGTKAGAPVVTDVPRTQLSNTHYITHKEAGTAGQDSAVWLFKWAAPAAAMGTVTLYGAFVGSNSDSQNSGDMVYVTKKDVILYGTQGIALPGDQGNKMYMFPNPASDHVTLDLETPVRDAGFYLYAMNGQLVKKVTWTRADQMTVALPDVPDGSYLTELRWEDGCIKGKLLIRH